MNTRRVEQVKRAGQKVENTDGQNPSGSVIKRFPEWQGFTCGGEGQGADAATNATSQELV